MELLQVLRDRDVPLTIVTAPELNATADHAFVLNILAAFAEFEREMIRSRLAESRAALKTKGRRVAGNVPYGFRAEPDTKQLILQPNEAERVREMFVMAGEGLTPRQIAEIVNRRKWLTSRGRSWTARQVTTTLTNGAYAGRIQDGDISRRGVHEAIVDEQLFAQVGSLIETRRRLWTTDEPKPIATKEHCLSLLPLPIRRGRSATMSWHWCSGLSDREVCPGPSRQSAGWFMLPLATWGWSLRRLVGIGTARTLQPEGGFALRLHLAWLVVLRVVIAGCAPFAAQRLILRSAWLSAAAHHAGQNAGYSTGC
jgi:hypothetical protein